MSKVTLTGIDTLDASSLIDAINTNNTLIENAVEKTLSRDGTTPNTMSASLDMNSNRVLNLPDPVSDTEPVRKKDLNNAVLGKFDVLSTFVAEPANKFLAGPSTGADALPTFRSLVVADIPVAMSPGSILNTNSAHTVLGRDSTGAGIVQELTVANGLELNGTGTLQRSALTGDVTATAGSNATTIASNAVTFAKMDTVSAQTLLGRDGGGTGNVTALTVGGGLSFTGTGGLQRDALNGDVTATAGSTGTAIASNAVTYAKMQDITTDTLIGRDTAATGDPESISVSGGLEFTGTSGIRRSALTGDVTATAGSNATTVANNAITYAKMQDITTDTLIGRDTAATGDPENISVSGGLSFTGSGGIQRDSLTGDITASAGSGITVIANNAVTTGKMAMSASFLTASMQNGYIVESRASNASTIAIKNYGGANPSTSDVTNIVFSTVLGVPSVLPITSALSITIPSGTTIGTVSLLTSPIYVYALNNSGTVELALSLKFWGRQFIGTTTAISGGATSTVLYSTTARTSVSCTLLGVIYTNQTTAGTWAAAPSAIATYPFDRLSYRFRANLNGVDQASFLTSTDTKVLCTNEIYDPDSAYDSTNSKFVCLEPGQYLFTGRFAQKAGTVPSTGICKVFLNAAQYERGFFTVTGNGEPIPCVTCINLIPGDVVELYAFQNGGSTASVDGITAYTSFSGNIIK